MSRTKRYALALFMDFGILFLSVALSFFVFYENGRGFTFSQLAYIFALFWVVLTIGFHLFHHYRHLWRFASMGESKVIGKSFTFAFVTGGMLHLLFSEWRVTTLPFSFLFVTWTVSLAAFLFSRLILWSINENKGIPNKNGKRTLIIGAGNAGILVVKELKKSTVPFLYPVAFIDDDPEKIGLHVRNMPVAGTIAEIERVIEQFHIETAIIAIPSASGGDITRIVKSCQKCGVTVRILPPITDIINGRVTLSMIREVNVEDLLGRPPIQLDVLGISHYVQDKTVLITGAGGSIGSEICRQISSFQPKKVLLLGHGENSVYAIEKELEQLHPHLPIQVLIGDIQDKNRLKHIFSTYRPQVVFHAAAHKHVPLMEHNPTEAVKNNIFGTKNLAECAGQYEVETYVQISTDKAVNPTSVMGATKRVAELIIQTLNQQSKTNFVAVRFGNVLGSRGSVVPLFKKQIQNGGPVTVTHRDMTRYFMTIPEAVQLVIQAGALAKGGEIFILDMGKPVKISELAHNLITLSGLTPGKDIEIRYTGMRPGEKLYEELFTTEEGHTASKHQLIYIARTTNVSKIDLPFWLNRLEQLVYEPGNEETDTAVKSVLKEIVPSYQIDFFFS
ncbi:polysaccharide biosynthesis protein [Domibacillus sp. PGB-M46]|uniref:nucleoside-diphosphate sugar epimerase/dehydratase n=1 Tax=Domibacillus sp. PGB-M46 TaxID=2910255 RepID=UPI001F56B6B4|nr:nucleoside-diphosphate sugar epimerase/dehydratase [Domibacillus sp. PGB-M46]MCI2252913.1 polysaccharide biosynthesis protein [Domibacillus sp. PGB-M46]